MRKLNSWIAGLLSMVMIGLGQYYNGQIYKAACFFLINVILGFLMFNREVFLSVYYLSLFGFIGLVWKIVAVVDAFIVARKLKTAPDAFYFKGLYISLIFLTAITLSGLLGAGMDLDQLGVRSFSSSKAVANGAIVKGDVFMADLLYYKQNPIKPNDLVIMAISKSSTEEIIAISRIATKEVKTVSPEAIVGRPIYIIWSKDLSRVGKAIR